MVDQRPQNGARHLAYTLTGKSRNSEATPIARYLFQWYRRFIKNEIDHFILKPLENKWFGTESQLRNLTVIARRACQELADFPRRRPEFMSFTSEKSPMKICGWKLLYRRSIWWEVGQLVVDQAPLCGTPRGTKRYGRSICGQYVMGN